MERCHWVTLSVCGCNSLYVQGEFSTDRAVCSLRNFREHVLSRKTGAGNPLRGEGQTGIKSEGWSSFPPFAGNKGRSAPIKEPGSGQASTSEGAIWLGSNNS